MKRQLTTLLIASAMSVFSAAHGTQLLVGSYTDGASEGLYRYAFSSVSGQIGVKPLQVLKSENPSWLTLSVDHRLLFAVNENGAGRARPAVFQSAPKTAPSSPSTRSAAAAMSRPMPVSAMTSVTCSSPTMACSRRLVAA